MRQMLVVKKKSCGYCSRNIGGMRSRGGGFVSRIIVIKAVVVAVVAAVVIMAGKETRQVVKLVVEFCAVAEYYY